MLNVIDEFTRECIAIRVSRKLKAVDVIDALGSVHPARHPRPHSFRQWPGVHCQGGA